MSTGTEIGLFDKQAQGVEGLTAANTWDGVTDATADRYKSAYTYDANGNIETVARFDETGTQYDDLAYHYEKSGTQLLRNRLYHLNESIDGGYGDIGVDGSAFHGAHEDVNLLNNYKYDELGNLIADKREEIANIEWTVSGKVKRITRTADSTKPPLEFAYGADGQRISKTVGDPLHGGYREYYLRDAQGNIMAMYRHTNTGPKSLKVTERPVYGSKRIGSYTGQKELAVAPTITNYPYTQSMLAPLKRYELTDHLGNVATVVTGRLLDGAGAGSAKQAEVVSAQGYEAFGSLLPGRNYSSDSYSRGFNGQLKDDEVYGATGTSYTAEFWQYDPRVGRRWNLDPVFTPSLSSYHAFELNPIWMVDPKGNRADEYDSDGNKISNLGGDKIDFFHQKNGDTKIVDRASGASNVINQGERLIRGYEHRDKNTSWLGLTLEWDFGKGPTKSLISDFDGSDVGFFGSMGKPLSSFMGKVRSELMSSPESKGTVGFSYREINPLTGGFDMWEQMLGRANVSWYKLGDDQVLFMMNDSKSMTSATYRQDPSYERSMRKAGGNTYQTYIWTASMSEVKMKIEQAQMQLMIRQKSMERSMRPFP